MFLHRYRLFAQVSLVLNRVFAQWQRQWHAHEKSLLTMLTSVLSSANTGRRNYYYVTVHNTFYLFGFRLDVYRRFLLNEFANLNLESVNIDDTES